MDMVSPVLEYLHLLHTKFGVLQEGEVATYIPQLALADKNLFGICLATTDGQVYEVGDTRHPFTIQSISKPFTYATALAAHGPEKVFRKVGVEPSGDAFNAISLDPQTGRPANPMINAGAIAATAMLHGDTPSEKFAAMLETFARYAGHPLCMDEEVYISERDTGFRNQAIAFLLRNFGILEDDPVALVDLYFRQCSLLVNCRDLAVMAATLAGGGVNPITGVHAVEAGLVESILSVMGSCGMYDYTGEWTFSVGLPSKSGVSGGIMAVLPGHLGIGVFSPPLDSHGNSLRGIAVCQELSRTFGLHLFNVPRVNRTVIHRAYTAEAVASNRVRSPEDAERLQTLGSRVRIYELQGDLSFGTAEVVVRDILQHAETLDFVILDLDRITDLNNIACDLLATLVLRLMQNEKQLLFAYRNSTLFEALQARIAEKTQEQENLPCSAFPDTDRALEWCENSLLAPSHTEQEAVPAEATVSLEAFNLLKGITPVETEALSRILCPLAFVPGAIIMKEGDQDDAVFLLTRGEVSVVVRQHSGGEKRLATFSAGMSFGEMALLEKSTRSATVYADSYVECYTVRYEDLARLWEAYPGIKTTLMENLAYDLSSKLRKTNGIIGALAQ